MTVHSPQYAPTFRFEQDKQVPSIGDLNNPYHRDPKKVRSFLPFVRGSPSTTGMMQKIPPAKALMSLGFRVIAPIKENQTDKKMEN